MVRKFIKIVLFIVLMLGSERLFAQTLATLSIANKLEILEYVEHQYGNNSKQYLSTLIEQSVECCDTTYHNYYKIYAVKLSKAFPVLKHIYGLDSEDFRLASVALSRFLLGKYVDEGNYDSYQSGVLKELILLENDIQKSNNNAIEFATILSNIYQFYDIDYNKALYFGKIKYDLTKKTKKATSDEYVYAVCNLISIYSKLHQVKKADKLISEYLALGVETAVSRDGEICSLLNYLPTEIDNSIYERLLQEFSYGFGDISDIIFSAQQCGMKGQDGKLQLIEKWVIPSQENPNSLFHYYISVGIGIGQYNPVKSIDYLMKAIEVANENKLTDKLYINDDGEWRHLYQYVAQNYQWIGDSQNAAHFYMEAAKELQKKYLQSQSMIDAYISCAVLNITEHYEKYKSQTNRQSTYLPFLLNYKETSLLSLKSLDILWNAFIVAHDITAIETIDSIYVKKESDIKQVVDYFVACAEQFQYDELYQEAIKYNQKAISYADSVHQPLLAYSKYEGMHFSRYHNIAYCWFKLGEDENYVSNLLFNLFSVGDVFGQESPDYANALKIIQEISASPTFGPILETILKKYGL